MKKTYYTNIEKKKLCNRNNGELKTLPRFDFQMEDYFSVIFVDSLNKIIEIDPTDQFYIAGGLDVMKNSENLLFYSEDFTLENNRLTFTIDTYTDNYLKHIKNTNTPIYLEIGILNEKKTILLQDIVLAEPRVYLDGVAPTNIEVYYTKAQIDEKLKAVKVEQTDPIYTADKEYIALKSELPTKTSQLENDSGFLSEANIPTKTSQLENDSGFLTTIPDEYVTQTQLTEKGYLTEIPAEYITETQLEGKNYVTETELSEKGYITTIPDEYVTETQLTEKGYLTEIPSEYITETELSQELTSKEDVIQYTETTNTTITLTKGVYYRNLNAITSLQLTIDQNSNDSVLLFSTGSTFTVTLNIDTAFKINQDFELAADKTYLIAVDNYTILWSEVQNYTA